MLPEFIKFLGGSKAHVQTFLKLCEKSCLILLYDKGFHRNLFERQVLKAKMKVLSAGHTVAMVTYSVTKLRQTCSPTIGQLIETNIVSIKIYVLERIWKVFEAT